MDTKKTHISESYLALKQLTEEKGFILYSAHNAFWVLDDTNEAFMRGTFEEVFEWIENTDHRDNLKQTYHESDVVPVQIEQLTVAAIAYTIIAMILFAISIISGITWIGFIALPFYGYALYRYFTNSKIRKK